MQIALKMLLFGAPCAEHHAVVILQLLLGQKNKYSKFWNYKMKIYGNWKLVNLLFENMEVKRAFTRAGGLRDTVIKLFKEYAENAVKEDALKMLKFEKDK